MDFHSSKSFHRISNGLQLDSKFNSKINQRPLVRKKPTVCLDTVVEAETDANFEQLSEQTMNRLDFDVITKRMLLCPNNLLFNQTDGYFQKDVVLDVLRTLQFRLSRLTDQRNKQSAKIVSLKTQIDQLNTEIDVSVDAQRQQQKNFESERQRGLTEIRKLRVQMAETTALFEQSELGKNRQLSQSSKQVQPKSNQCDCLNSQTSLEVTSLQIAVSKLEEELEEQKHAFEKVASVLRCQLAESNADARSLRLQLARYMRQSPSSPEKVDCQVTSNCNSCDRLQKLVDILQTKSSMPTGYTKLPQTSLPTLTIPVCSHDEVPDIISNCSNRSGDNQDKTCNTSSSDSYKFYTENSGCANSSNNASVSDLTTKYLEDQLGSTLSSSMHETELLQHPVVKFLAEEVKLKTETISKLRNTLADLKASELNNSPNQNNDFEHRRLIDRLTSLESEVDSSADQIKESNIEFLQLRERLTNATVEKAHLKATVDGLDDQVNQLEAILYERSQELRVCQSQLVDLRKSTTEQILEPKHSVFQLPCDKQTLVTSSPTKCIPPNYEYNRLIRYLPASQIQSVHSKYNTCCINISSVSKNIQFSRPKSLSPILNYCQKKANAILQNVCILLTHLFGKQPRIILLLCLIIYVSFLHILLISIWI